MNKFIRWSIPILMAIVVAGASAAPIPPKTGATDPKVGSLSRKQVGADANWLIYINVKQFNASKFGTLLQSDRAPAEMRKPIEQSQELLGFNPLKDMDHITLYGRTEDPQSGVALFNGRFDAEKVLARSINIRASAKVMPDPGPFTNGSNRTITRPCPSACFRQDKC